MDAKERALVEEVNERPWQTLVESPKQGTVRVSNLERIFRTGEEKDLGRDFTDEEAVAHERQWQARYTAITEESSRKAIIEGIEQVAVRLERAAEDIRRELAYEQTNVAEKAKRTQHTIAWLLPNLGAHDLTGHALEWTIANRELQRFLTEGIEPSS